jgi:hypothetical protein
MELIIETLGYYKQLNTEQLYTAICLHHHHNHHTREAVELTLLELEKAGLVARTLFMDEPITDLNEIKSQSAEVEPYEQADQPAVVCWNLTRAGRARVNPPNRSQADEQSWRNLDAQLSQEVAKAGATMILMEELCPDMDLEGNEYLVRLYVGTLSISFRDWKSRVKTKASISKYLLGLIILLPEWVEADRWLYRDLPQIDSGTSQNTLPVILITTSTKQAMEYKEVLDDLKQKVSVIEIGKAGEFIPDWLKEQGVPEPP